MSVGPLGLVPDEPKFHGATYDGDLDFDRLKNNTVRVFALLLDGQWHESAELRSVGGSEATRRARSLREEQYGSLVVERERITDGNWRYRLNLDSVTRAMAEKILAGRVKDPKVPRVLAYDLEFARPLPNNDWRRMAECGISVLSSWSSEEDEPRVWLPEEGEQVLKAFCVHALSHDAFVTWNGLGCDDPMIYSQSPLWAEVLKHGKRVDLGAIVGLYSLSERKGLDLDYLTGVLSRGVPNNFPELVGYKPGAKVNVRSGWSLEPTYCTTFGKEASKSMPGEEAPRRWQEGRKGEVISYCIGDSKRLLQLWKHAWKGQPLKSHKGMEVTVPRAALGAL